MHLLANRAVDSVRRFGRRRRWRWLPNGWRLAAVVTVLVAAAAVWAVAFSTLLLAEGVVVSGAVRLTPGQVTSAARVPAGVPLARLDLDAIASRVASLPSVRSVKVSRRWPHTVAITVTERSPVALLETAEGLRGIDATGAVFALRPNERPDLPRLVPGETSTPRAIIEGAKVVARLPAQLTRRLGEVTVASRDAVTLHLRSGDQVMWGSAQETRRKARVLAALLRRPAAVYDVSVPSLPTTTGL
jgi:cell division protein FtsQ